MNNQSPLLARAFAGLIERTWLSRLDSEKKRALYHRLRPWQQRLALRLLAPGVAHARRSIDVLTARLYSLGFTERPLSDLLHFVDHAVNPRLRGMAAWELAVWYAGRGTTADARVALQYLYAADACLRGKSHLDRSAVLHAECHNRLGLHSEAQQVLRSRLFIKGESPEISLAMANCHTDPCEKLWWTNRALVLYGLAPLSMGGKAHVLPIDRLLPGSGAAHGAPAVSGPLVTVITPAFNCSATIGTALASLFSVLTRRYCEP